MAFAPNTFILLQAKLISLIYVYKHPPSPHHPQELIISITIGFAAVFALIAGFMNSVIGRKGSMVVASCIFIAGSLTLALARNKETLLVGRAIVGAGIGQCLKPVNVFLALAKVFMLGK